MYYEILSPEAIVIIFVVAGGVALGGLTATAPIRVENVTCSSNATLASDCTAIEPPISPNCFNNFSAAGVQCVQGIIWHSLSVTYLISINTCHRSICANMR